jgi:YD repeat-containing protein
MQSVIQRSYSYYPWTQSNEGGKLSGLSSVNAASTTLQQLSYQYDANGSITQIADTVANETSAYTYDALDRLTSMSIASVWSEAFSYDSATGRMSQKQPNGGSLTDLVYDASHPHAVAQYGTNTYTYDADGNQVTRNLSNAEYGLTYDAENRLAAIALTRQNAPAAMAAPTETPTENGTPTQMQGPDLNETATPTETVLSPTSVPQAGARGAYHLAALLRQDIPTETPTPAETPTSSETAGPSDTQIPASTETSTPDSLMSETPAATQTATPTNLTVASETASPTGTAAVTATETPTGTTTSTPTEKATPIGPQSIWYLYDGDRKLVLCVIDGVRTYYPGKHYDREDASSGTIVKKYYSLNGQTVAVRTVLDSTDTLNWILTDHLNSTAVTAAEDGSKLAELRYSAFGEIRFSSGTTPTEYQYTGQLNASYIKLSWYNSRWYDSYLTWIITFGWIIMF